jgi:Ca2+-binding RTX toxin-like protein
MPTWEGETGDDLMIADTGSLLAGGGDADTIIGSGAADIILADTYGVSGNFNVFNLPDGGGQLTDVVSKSIGLGYNADKFRYYVYWEITQATGEKHYVVTRGRMDAEAAGDTIISGAGDDYILAEYEDDFVDAGSGVDVVIGDHGSDYILGGAGDDFIFGDFDDDAAGPVGGETPQELGAKDGLVPGYLHGRDILSGGTGNDIVNGNGGDDQIDGGEGDDALSGDDGITPGQWHGSDIVAGGLGADKLFGDGGDDTLDGGDGNDQVSGDNDHLDGQYHGNDFLEGGVGDDRLWGNGGDDVLVGGEGVDHLEGDYTTAKLNGSFHGADTLDGGSGDDGLIGGGGDDTLFGGEGDDILSGDDGDTGDVETQFHGDDILDGGTGADTLRGDGGNDYLDGGSGQDTLEGGAGDDVLVGGAGADGMDGGTGNDWYELAAGDGPLSAAGETEAITDAGGTDTVALSGISAVAQVGDQDLWIQYGSGDTVAILGGANGVIERFDVGGESLSYAELVGRYAAGPVIGIGMATGGHGDDTITATTGNTQVSGGTGNDTIFASGGNNSYSYNLGDGMDSITDASRSNGFTGSNQLVMGAGITAADVNLVRNGNDLYLRLPATAGEVKLVNQYANGGIDLLVFSDGTSWDRATIDLHVNRELTEGADTFTGTANPDTVSALGGIDTIRGMGGDDVLDGGAGADFLYGGSGDDTLDGRSDAAADYMQGDDGADTYLFGRASGADSIAEYGDLTSIDSVRFDANIAPADVSVTRSGSNLVFAISGSTATLTVVNGATSPSDTWRVERYVFGDGSVWTEADVRQKLMAAAATDGNDNIAGFDGNETIRGLGGSDWISGGDGNYALYGDAGVDTLVGGNGDDLLDGGSGDDKLYGNAGSDVFLFGRGSGFDTLYCDDSGASSVDAVVMGEGITPADVGVYYPSTNSYTDVMLRINGTSDYLQLAGYRHVGGEAAVVDEIRFLDGTVWRYADVMSRLPQASNSDDRLQGSDGADTVSLLAGNDSFSGGPGGDTIDGGAGNDNLYGGDGNDVINGGDGNDTITGDLGNDTLRGGAGVDQLTGKEGDDTYWFGRGDGQDSINEYLYYYGPGVVQGGNDTLNFTAGVLPTDVSLYRMGQNLIAVIDGSSTQVTMNDFFASSFARVERMVFTDGTIWDSAAIDARTVSGTANAMTGTGGNDTFLVDNTGDTISEGADQGIDTVQSSVNWTLGDNIENLTFTGTLNTKGFGNALDNVIVDNDSNNVLYDDGGGSSYNISAGFDTLRGGKGDDVYYVNYEDTVVELAGEGNDTIVARNSYTLPNNVEIGRASCRERVS